LAFTIKGAFNNGLRIYNILHNEFLVDLCYNDSILKDFIRRVAAVIYYLSALGLVHGDLKPENILLD